MTRRWVNPDLARWASGLLASVVLVAAVSGLVGLLDPRVPALYLLVLYVLVVMSVAIGWGTAIASVAAVLSVAVFVYLFLPPVRSWWLADWPEALSLGVFLVTAVVAGGVASPSPRAGGGAGRARR